MGSLADSVLADHVNSSPPTDTAHHYKDGKGSKTVRKLVTEKPFTSK